MRGLVPRTWVVGILGKRPAEQEQWQAGVWTAEGIPVVPTSAKLVAGTDGAGGRNGPESRLRREGWSFVVVDSNDAELVGWRSATSLDEQPTIQRTTLVALLQLAKSTTGDIDLWCGSQITVEGSRAGSRKEHGSDGELWQAFWDAVRGREGDVRVRKIKSHLDDEPEQLKH